MEIIRSAKPEQSGINRFLRVIHGSNIRLWYSGFATRIHKMIMGTTAKIRARPVNASLVAERPNKTWFFGSVGIWSSHATIANQTTEIADQRIVHPKR